VVKIKVVFIIILRIHFLQRKLGRKDVA